MPTSSVALGSNDDEGKLTPAKSAPKQYVYDMVPVIAVVHIASIHFLLASFLLVGLEFLQKMQQKKW